MMDSYIKKMREDAAQAFRASIEIADPARALRKALNEHGLPCPRQGGRTIVIAVGKAAPAMLREIQGVISGAQTLICVTHRENQASVSGAEMFHAGHPEPDAIGARAAARVIEVLQSATAEDVVIALISGGGSALLPAPPEGVSLADKQQLNRLLLQSGLDIMAMNLIRQQVSVLKGGGLVRLAPPACVTAFILSDVVGDDLRAIASGPTVAPLGTAQEACALLKEAAIFDDVPQSIKDHLQSGSTEVHLVSAQNHLIGGNRQSVAAAACALAPDYDTQIIEAPLVGDVSYAAAEICHKLTSVSTSDLPQAFIWGGETTVKVAGSGAGGRNQELALRVTATAGQRQSGAQWVFLSGGTDGRDGPTEAAGAIVDQGTLLRIKTAGGDIAALLENNDSNLALRLSDDLLITGATGTNVADVQILLRAKRK